MATNLNAPYSTFNNAGRDIIYQYAVTPEGSCTPQPPFNDAPIGLLSAHFTGRQSELALIAKAFERLRGNSPLRCVLYGNQGVGKTQLTFEWARETFDRGENSYILWISATTVEKLDQGFTQLLHRVNHRDRSHSDQAVRLMAARQWLEDVESGNWLLVLDNVFPETANFLREHLPRMNGRGSILFTTRTRNVAETLVSKPRSQDEMVEVSLLDVKDGVELFTGHFEKAGSHLPSVKVEQIVKSVACLPLAISHAAAFMKQSTSTLDDMLALYESQHKFDAISWEDTLSEYEHKSVAATFTHQLEDLERRFTDASKFLKVLACFDPENIPLDMLITGAKAISIPPKKSSPKTTSYTISLLALIQSPVELRKTIVQLKSRSLVACHNNSQTSSLRIHDLIQLIVLETSKKDGSEQECFELAVQMACHAFEQIGDYQSPASWPQCEALVPHIQSLTPRQDISSKAKTQLLEANRRVALYVQHRGRYREAENLYHHVLSERKRLFGSEDKRTLAVMYNLGCLYLSQSRSSDAKGLMEHVLQSREKQLGSEHPDTLLAMRQLADVHTRQKRYDEAEKMLNKVVEAQEKQLGLEHIQTVRTKHTLAAVYHSQRRCADAETLFKQVLQSKEKLHGPEHPSTLATKHQLANVYRAQKRYSDAQVLYKQVVQSREKLLGSNHPSTLATQHNLGLLYSSRGRLEEAEALLVHVLSRREEVLGHSHPDTRNTRRALASIRLIRQGRGAENPR